MSRLQFKSNGDHHDETVTARFVSVLSGKGGVGKSVLSYNLAERASAAGHRVLLIDADFASGNVHILANARAEYGIVEYASEKLSLKEAVTPLGESLDLLAAISSGPEQTPQSVDEIARFMNRLQYDASAYDLVMIDHASGVSGPAAVLAHGSDLNLLVLVPELTSIADAYGLYKFLQQSGDHLHADLLLNRVQDPEEADFIYNKFAAICERFLGAVPKLSGLVPEDKMIRKAVGSQSPVAVIAPQAGVTKAIEDMCSQLVGRLNVEPMSHSLTRINKTPALADIRG